VFYMQLSKSGTVNSKVFYYFSMFLRCTGSYHVMW